MSRQKAKRKRQATTTTALTPLVIRMPVDVRSLSLSILAGLAVIIALQYAQSVLIPVVLGILLSYALSPIVTSLARLHVPRAIGAAVAVALLVGSIGVGVYTLSDEAGAIVAKVPEAAQRIRQRVAAQRSQRGTAILQQVQDAAKEIEKTADAATQTRGGHTSLTDGTRPAPARGGRRARVPSL